MPPRPMIDSRRYPTRTSPSSAGCAAKGGYMQWPVVVLQVKPCGQSASAMQRGKQIDVLALIASQTVFELRIEQSLSVVQTKTQMALVKFWSVNKQTESAEQPWSGSVQSSAQELPIRGSQIMPSQSEPTVHAVPLSVAVDGIRQRPTPPAGSPR